MVGSFAKKVNDGVCNEEIILIKVDNVTKTI